MKCDIFLRNPEVLLSCPSIWSSKVSDGRHKDHYNNIPLLEQHHISHHYLRSDGTIQTINLVTSLFLPHHPARGRTDFWGCWRKLMCKLEEFLVLYFAWLCLCLCSDLRTKCCACLSLLPFMCQSLRQRHQRVNQLQSRIQIQQLGYHPVIKTIR